MAVFSSKTMLRQRPLFKGEKGVGEAESGGGRGGDGVHCQNEFVGQITKRWYEQVPYLIP